MRLFPCLFTCAVILIAAVTVQAEDLGERTIVFPEGRSFGKVLTMDVGAYESRTWWGAWSPGVDAKDAVKIPAGKLWALEAGPAIQADPALLDKLPPDSLEALMVSGWKANELSALLGHLVRFKKLRQLVATDTDLHGANLAPLAELPRLADLNLYSETAEAADWAPLAQLTRVRRLKLGGTGASEALSGPIAKMASLESLNVCGKDIAVAGLAALAGLKDLHRLELFGTHTITTEGYATLATLASVKDLSLGNLGVTPEELKALAKAPSLESLEFRDASDAHLDAIASMQSLKRLELRISVQSQATLSEHGFVALAKLASLEDLQIGLSGKASETGLAALATLRNLKGLWMPNIGGLTDEHMAVFANMPALTNLTISGEEITDQGLAKLEGCKSLKALRLEMRTKVTPEGAARLQKSIPGLQITTRSRRGGTEVLGNAAK